MSIFCPICEWRPTPTSRWQCRPGCGFVWNTFDTRGICPHCFKLWRQTRCLRCREMSLHELWYHQDPGEQDTTAYDADVDSSTLVPA